MERASLSFPTPLGLCTLSWSEAGLQTLTLSSLEGKGIQKGKAPTWVLQAADSITRYLQGETVDLQAIPIDLQDLPPFRKRALEVLRTTLPGETLTYGDLARLTGSPGAARAIGQAMARNPLPILIPCHRVVAANGPGGFSLFGSLATKQRLQALETAPLRHTGSDGTTTS